MTTDRDFKRLVRDRMRQTGQNYTSARAQLCAEQSRESAATFRQGPASAHTADLADRDTAYERARQEHERVVGRFFDGRRLRSIPVKRRARAFVLLELLTGFEPGRQYAEQEVNEILGQSHEDYAYLRRELVNFGYLQRFSSIYQTVDRAPERPRAFRDEYPDWEAMWLPGYLARL